MAVRGEGGDQAADSRIGWIVVVDDRIGDGSRMAVGQAIRSKR
jgi:hypothetical protein